MNKIDKFLKKLFPDERQEAQILVARLIAHEWDGLNIKKLQGHDNLWRCRHGKLRIIFEHPQNRVIIVHIGRRNDTTYNF